MGSCQHAAIIAGLLQFQHLIFFLIPREQFHSLWEGQWKAQLQDFPYSCSISVGRPDDTPRLHSGLLLSPWLL